MLEDNRHRVAKQMRWVARVIGLLTAGLCLSMLIVSTTSDVQAEGWEAFTQVEVVQGSLIGVLGAMALAGCIVSWWRERLASILLVLTAVGFGIHIGLFAGHNHFLAWSMMGLPYLVAGMLFLNSWRLSRRIAQR